MATPAGDLLAAIGVDCERHDSYLLGQDVDALSSLGFVGAGVVLVLMVRHDRLPRTLLVLAAMLTLEGIGSVLYHGWSGPVAHYLHDVPLAAVLGFVAGWQIGRIGARRAAGTAALVGTGVAVVVGSAGRIGGWTNAVTGALVVTIVAAEVVARRRGRRPVWGVGPVALLAVAVVTWLAGTSESPLCDEDSLLQLHGAWHLLAAVVVVVWADRAAASRRGTAPRPTRSGRQRSR